MAQINIEGNKFEYEEVRLSYDTIKAMDKQIAKELLIEVRKIFNSNGVKFCLVFGTLLGAVRDKDFINGDEDIDIYTPDEKGLLKMIPKLYENNIKICRAYKHKLYSFIYRDGCYVDVYILRPYKFSLWGKKCFNLAGYATPKKYLMETQKIEFLNEMFDCPLNPEGILEFWYGKSWQIPKSGHNFRYEIYPAYCYKRIIYFIKSIIKVLIGYKYWRKKHGAIKEI